MKGRTRDGSGRGKDGLLPRMNQTRARFSEVLERNLVMDYVRFLQRLQGKRAHMEPVSREPGQHLEKLHVHRPCRKKARMVQSSPERRNTG